MSDKLKPYADLKVKVREYQDKDGKTKGVYSNIGTLFSSPHGSHLTIKLDTVPVGEWSGWVSVFKKEDNRPLTQNEVLEKSGDFAPKDLEDKPIDLSEIPF